MLAAIYCRVSTTAQAEDGTSLDSQKQACLKWASEHGYLVKGEHVFLEDYSGATLERPKLERARELVRSGSVQAIVSYAVDRLARDPIHIGIIAEECAKRGGDLLFVQEPLDSSPEGALIRYVKGYAAQIERERIKERTLRGKRSRAQMGFMVQGTGRGMYGYRYVTESKKRVIYEPEALIVQRVFNACVQGESCHTIALKLNQDGISALSGGQWHPLTIKRMLTNSAYMGVTIFGKTRSVKSYGKRRIMEPRNKEEWIEIPGVTPPIISQSVYETVQEILKHPKRLPNVNRTYLLTGYIECTCGAPIIGTTINRTYRYYRCRSTWPTAAKPKCCDAPYIKADKLEAEVWKVIRDVLESPELIVQELESQQGDQDLVVEEIERVRSLTKRLSDQEKRLIRLFGLGQVTEEYLLGEIEQVKKVRSGYEESLEKLEEKRRQMRRLDGVSDQVRAFCAHVASQLEEFDFDKKRLALQALQVRMVVSPHGAKLFGAIPADLATIERTSA